MSRGTIHGMNHGTIPSRLRKKGATGMEWNGGGMDLSIQDQCSYLKVGAASGDWTWL